MYIDVFYRGALVARQLCAVADARYYVPIPSREYPDRGTSEQGAPVFHYTRWQLGLATVAHRFEHAAEPLEDVLSQMDYVLDDDGPVSSEPK